MAEIPYLTNHWDSKSPEITQFGGVGGQEWRLSGQKAGFTPRLIRHVCPQLSPPAPYCYRNQRNSSLKSASRDTHSREQKTGNLRPQLSSSGRFCDAAKVAKKQN
eukprot:43618-Pelagomonas_calceolata.AAC.1